MTTLESPATRAPDVAPTVDPPPRAFTARALLIGGALALAMGALAPFNDWSLNNAYLFNNALPPIAVAILALFVGALNPLLGRRRFARGELAVIATLLLAVGGVASSGLIRFWSATIAGPARKLAREPRDELREPLSGERLARALAELRAAAEADFARLDADGDGRLRADEVPGGAARIARDDRDGDGALSRAEYADGRLAHDPRAQARWRWAIPRDLVIAVPPLGDVDASDPEFDYVVGGYFDGGDREARVAHGGEVAWRTADGVVHRAVALGGAARERRPAATTLDLDGEVGGALRGRRAGERVELPGGVAEVLAVRPPPTVPWSAWIGPVAAWSPFVVGLCVASVAIAFLVRHQWLENERLPYPVSAALLGLMDDPAGGRRLPAALRTRAFRIGAAAAFVVVAWRALDLNGLVPFTLPLEVDLSKPLAGDAWSGLLHRDVVAHPRLYLTFVALAFLVPASTSFSMWSVYLLANVVVLALRARGVDVGLDHVARVDVGAYAGIAAMILWLGRRYYLAVLIACARPSRDPAVRAAVPWLWAAIAGMAAIVAWLAAHGAPAGLAIVVVLALFGFLLVCARILAEAGVAYLMFPANINSLTAVLGFGLPAASLMPLAMIGMCVVLAREALMPYAATASQLADRCRVGSGRLAPLMAVTAVVGAGVALAAKLWFSYRYFGHCDGWHTYAHEMDAVAAATGADRDAAARAVGSPASAATCYALGAALVAACGAGRLLIASWPLHPLALAVSLTWAGGHLWPSFLVAWLAKACVMRYGGVGVYRSLVPAAIGLIVGESLAIAAYGAIKLVAVVGFGRELPAYIDALPG